METELLFSVSEQTDSTWLVRRSSLSQLGLSSQWGLSRLAEAAPFYVVGLIHDNMQLLKFVGIGHATDLHYKEPLQLIRINLSDTIAICIVLQYCNGALFSL